MATVRFLLASLFTTVQLLGGAAPTQAQRLGPTLQWDRTFGGTQNDALQAVQHTSDGGYILGGASASGSGGDKTQASQGRHDYWVVKLDASGGKQWDHAYGGTGNDFLRVVVQTRDGGYLLAGYSDSPASGDKTQASQGNTDYWVLKLDASGTKQWDRTFGGSGNDLLRCAQQTADGGYVLGGYSNSGLDGDKTQAGQGQQDYWVLKLDASGTTQWDRTYGGTGADMLFALQQTTDGGFIVGGGSSSGQGGDKTQGSQGGSDYWLLKLAANGTKIWDQRFGGSGEEALASVQQTPDGGYVLGGGSSSGLSGDKSQASQGNLDYWLLKVDASGTKQWDRTYGGTEDDMLVCQQPTADGGYVLGGYSFSGRSGDKTQASRGLVDYWVLQVDASGTLVWDRTVGGAGDDLLMGLQQPADGGYVLGGYSTSGLSGDKSQANHGGYDYWVLKLGSTPLATTSSSPSLRAFTVSPTPAHSQLTLHLAPQTLRTRLQVSLLNATGQTVYTQPVLATEEHIPVHVGQHPPGLYLLRVQGPAGYVATQRLLLE
ncbi:T9SS type A sorting domain-containing protein [Hymenobacter norwichensis]|uniref:T9SS type A sorting domain-containing protein n=1 Tax=Hymenobacter norwichensis TaxID=223903 RepID=UPI0003B3AD1B|nr:T9SS type A sorting domain-containing protein [Hymenobacter norwichensis]